MDGPARYQHPGKYSGLSFINLDVDPGRKHDVARLNPDVMTMLDNSEKAGGEG